MVLNIFEEEIRKALQRCNLNIKQEFVTIPDTEDIGTAQTLHHIRDKITVSNIWVTLMIDLDFASNIHITNKYYHTYCIVES